MDAELAKIYRRMDEIDKLIVTCFEQRMNTTLELAKYKHEHNLPILDTVREQQIIERNLTMLDNANYSRALESLTEKLMLLSRNLQQDSIYTAKEYLEFVDIKVQPLTVLAGYQGVAGSFSQQALQRYFHNQTVLESNYLNFEDVFIALQNQNIEYGVVPIENSSTGAINDIYDLLNKYEVCIVGEYCLPIEQCLLAKPNTKLEDIKKVYSHPQGFSQSREFLKQYDWELIPYFNTAKSAEYVAANTDKHIAAIAGEQACKLYNLKVIQTGINFNSKNYTRFVILGHQKQIFAGSDKVSLIISLPHKAGSLARVLNYFEEYNINLLKLESRPNQTESWSYYFYIDFKGNLHDRQVKSVLAKIESDSIYFKVLGNYPQAIS